MEEKSEIKGLPENAYRELKEGEEYIGVVHPSEKIPEVSPRSLILGLIMSGLFSGAAAFLGLKIGQVFEAAIPIAILAVGFSVLFKRKSTILENVIIQSIGACSGVIVAGAIFTIPALYILGLSELTNFFQIFTVSLFGGILGIVFLIPLRRYFVAEQHGKLPFPEATATTEILVAGERGGKQALVLVYSMIIGGIYDFVMINLEAWKEVFSTKFLPFMDAVTNKAKAVFSLNVGAAVLGLGYIIGLRYAAIICAGSFLSWFVFVPLFSWLGDYIPSIIPPVTDGSLIRNMDAHGIFGNYVRHIGIGGIFAAGIIGILKSSKIIISSFSIGLKEIFSSKKGEGEKKVVRTNWDLKMSTVLLIILSAIIILFLFFRFSILPIQNNPTTLAVTSLLVVTIISFLFTTVAAYAIAIVGVNPVSGMTLMTLMVSSLLLIAAGLKGTYGMLAALLIGGVVCTALSMSGGFITDLKIGYWLGSTPRQQERFKFLGTLVAAATVGGVIILLNKVYGFVGPQKLEAPQANAMAAVIKTFMSEAEVPWALYGTGAAIAVIMEMISISPLAFALGMYIPIYLNTPILAGAIIAQLVKKGAGDEKIAQKRHERGTLIASGFIAGGAIMGVIGAVIKYFGVNLSTGIAENDWANYISLIMFLIISFYLYFDARRADKISD